MGRESDLRAIGMESCALRYREQLEIARRIAYECAVKKSVITSDDVREEAEARGLCLSFSKNWSGSVFRGKEWESVGFAVSRHSEGHGRAVRLWKLRVEQRKEPVLEKKHDFQVVEVKKQSFPEELFSIPQVPDYSNFGG